MIDDPVGDIIGDYRGFAAMQHELFEDLTHVKFHRSPLYDAIAREEGVTFVGFAHVDDWVPQRLVTATGPSPLPL